MATGHEQQHRHGEQRLDGPWDPLIAHLHELRAAAGTPSYQEIARRVSAQRIADGQDEHAARIAKSSVHDTFRFGRVRINEALVREIVRALDGDPTQVRSWVAACQERPADPPAAVAEPAPLPERPSTEPLPAGPSARQQVLLIVACLALNLAGREFVDFFRLPFYLDMVGTAIAAIALGPWRGAAVGGLTNVVGIIGSGWISLPFALVNITGALLWGYGVRRWGMGRSLPRFFALNVATAVACSVVAVPIIVTFLGEELRVGRDVITELASESIDTFILAISFSNLLTSTGDKLVSGFVALVVVSALPAALRAGARLTFLDQRP